MEQDSLKDFLKKALGNQWDKFKEWNEQLDKYFEELEKKYEQQRKEREQKPWNQMKSGQPNIGNDKQNKQNQQNNQNYKKSESSKKETLTQEQKYYHILELPYGANFEQIKIAYRNLVKQYHPDRFENHPDKKAVAQEVTRQINEAYFYFKQKFNA